MPNTPTYILYHGRNTSKDKDSKKIWTRIGAAWPNKSGKGFNLSWDYLPGGDGPTGGKLRYPAISSKALLHTTLARLYPFLAICVKIDRQ